jgi:hypothetical protein
VVTDLQNLRHKAPQYQAVAPLRRKRDQRRAGKDGACIATPPIRRLWKLCQLLFRHHHGQRLTQCQP